MAEKKNDPMDFVRSMWGGKGFTLPGMITPTLNTDELDKRIKELRTVEGWLRTNLSMLQMTIQNLEMQSTTLGAVKTMSKMYADQAAPGKQGKPGSADATAKPAAADTSGSLAQAAMWPWNLMQQMQEQMHHAAETATAKAATTPSKTPPPAASTGKTEERTSAATSPRNRRKPGSDTG